MADDTYDPTGLFNGAFYSLPPNRAAVMSALLRGEAPPQAPAFNVPPLVPDSVPASMPSRSPGNPAQPQPQALPQAMPRQVNQPQGGQYVQRPTSPLDTSDIEARNAELGRQRAAAEQAAAEASKPPDASALEVLGQQRNASSARALVLALAAQRAGENFQPITQAMLKRSDEANAPIRMTGGQLTSEGWAADPGYMQQMAVKASEAKIARIDQALQQNLQMGERRRLEAEKAAETAALRDAMLGTQVMIAQQGSLDRRYAADLAHQDRAAAAAEKANAPRQLPVKQALDLANDQQTAANFAALGQEFKPEYAGFTGTVSTAAGKLPFVTNEATEWWKNYKKQTELIERHGLFGAALTPHELASWREADISPAMDAAAVERNLNRRAQIMVDKYQNARRTLGGMRYDVSGLPEAPGPLNLGAAQPGAVPPAGGTVDFSNLPRRK